MKIIREFLAYAWQEKKYWLIPMIAVFVILGVFVVVFQSASATPFIYALF